MATPADVHVIRGWVAVLCAHVDLLKRTMKSNLIKDGSEPYQGVQFDGVSPAVFKRHLRS